VTGRGSAPRGAFIETCPPSLRRLRSAAHDQTSTYAPSAGLRTRGLVDRTGRFPTDRRFPGTRVRPVLYGDLRSRLPLRGSPGFAPGSLLIPPDKNCLAGTDSNCPVTDGACGCQQRCEAAWRSSGRRVRRSPAHDRKNWETRVAVTSGCPNVRSCPESAMISNVPRGITMCSG